MVLDIDSRTDVHAVDGADRDRARPLDQRSI